jgi:hypothetical protein
VGDAAVVGRRHVRNGAISTKTENTGMRVTIQILPDQQATLDVGPTGDLAFITASSGNRDQSLDNLLAAACKATGGSQGCGRRSKKLRDFKLTL